MNYERSERQYRPEPNALYANNIEKDAFRRHAIGLTQLRKSHKRKFTKTAAEKAASPVAPCSFGGFTEVNSENMN